VGARLLEEQEEDQLDGRRVFSEVSMTKLDKSSEPVQAQSIESRTGYSRLITDLRANHRPRIYTAAMDLSAAATRLLAAPSGCQARKRALQSMSKSGMTCKMAVVSRLLSAAGIAIKMAFRCSLGCNRRRQF